MVYATRSSEKPQHISDAPVLDWSTTALAADYPGHYVKIVDNVFTSEECAELIKLAESDSEWKQAAVHYGLLPHQNYVNTEYRNSERILRFDHDAAEKLYKKLLPYVQEFVEVKPGDEWEGIFTKRGFADGTWTLVGLVVSINPILTPILISFKPQRTLELLEVWQGPLLQRAL